MSKLDELPLTDEEVKLLSQMRIPLWYAPNGNVLIASGYWQTCTNLHRRVIAAALQETRKGGQHQ
jgi:hypothetical protein